MTTWGTWQGFKGEIAVKSKQTFEKSCPDIPGGPGSAHAPYNAANKTTAHLQTEREDHRPCEEKILQLKTKQAHTPF